MLQLEFNLMPDKTDFIKEKTIRFLQGKDFQGAKLDLIKFAQAHHSGSFQDFNEASPGMAYIDFQAATTDKLSYYLDFTWNELKQDTAQLIENAAAIAKSKGYQPKGKAAANTLQTFI